MLGQISQYVLKVHSRCDLACDHCYVYELADDSWRTKPRAISPATVDAIADRIAEHAARHNLPVIHIVLHGGEPLLLGKPEMQGLLSILDAKVRSVTKLDLRVHTNGIRLDRQWCELFADYGVRVGVSLDGDQAANDLHRRYADGRSSYRLALAALALLREPEHRDLYAGILCTIDLKNDPIAVYTALRAEKPPNLDFLLPHANWESTPAGTDGDPAPYARWLTQIYHCWIEDGRPMPIRLFDSLLSAAAGGPSFTEAAGLDPVDLVVVDTDGSWEQPDSLKSAFNRAPATGLTVFSDPVDEVARQPGFVSRQSGLAGLCETCQNCEIAGICGGGLYAHRYSHSRGFDNPTVYCADMKALIATMTADVTERRAAVPATGSVTHEIADADFDALAAGPGTVAAVLALAQMRLSVTRALVATVASAGSAGREADLLAAATQGWELLCELDASHPDQVGHVLRQPFVHAWALRCLRPPSEAYADLDRANLATLAAACALRAGRDVSLPLPVRDDQVFFPTLGALRLEDHGRRLVTAEIKAGRVTVAGQPGSWLPAHQIGDGLLPVTIEDLDPFRDCQEWPAAGRQAPSEWHAWQSAVIDSGRRLSADVPGYAATLAAGLSAIVPLRPAESADRAATSRNAFGAVAIALPRLRTELDALILHEFQHVKLHALVDLRALFDPADIRRVRVPWRPDPRPVEGVLHGIYAYLALTHLARSRGPAASEMYLRYQSWICAAIDKLRSMGVLTNDGKRFVDGMYTAATEPANYE